MIELLGHEGTAEFEAAQSIADALEQLWPGIRATDPDEDMIRIAAGAKISGYQVSDIDVVICARLRPGRQFMPRKVLKDADGTKVLNRPVMVPNLVVAVEVKDHSAENVRVSGDTISVRYSRTGKVSWKSATDQNIAQVHSLREYFDDQYLGLFVHRLVIMRGLDQINVGGAIARRFSGADLLSAIASVSHVFKTGRGYQFRSGRPEVAERALASPLFNTVTPTSLDRARMDRIAVRGKGREERLALFGNKMITFRGRGGCGKTVMLLQTAWDAYEQRGARSLFLTYNHALSADVTRLTALLHIPAAAERGGIAIRTVMSFMFTWFSRLELIGPEQESDWDGYEGFCETACRMIEGGAVSAADIQAIKDDDPESFDFDYVIVDEAQDWPSAELSLLKLLYSPHQLCLADGVDQLVRGARANWTAGVPKSERVVIPLRRCLRMKSNLAAFANTVAELAGVNWRVEPNDEAGGGRVILLDGPYAGFPDLHEELLRSAYAAGNAEIDFLMCVPPGDVQTDDKGRHSDLAKALEGRGYSVWDGTNERARKDFPRSPGDYRVVQYQSCRGLEGWTVVADRLDEFWEQQRSQNMPTGMGNGQADFQSGVEHAADEAWRWCLIPLTRPIDTIVIAIGDVASEAAAVLRQAAERLPDIVEWIGPAE